VSQKRVSYTVFSSILLLMANVFYQNTLQYVVPKLSLLLNVISCATSDNAFVLFISLIAMSMLGPIIIQISEP